MIELLTILAVGFFLGMRHATDPDHVIAVSTIVSRERSKQTGKTICSRERRSAKPGKHSESERRPRMLHRQTT